MSEERTDPHDPAASGGPPGGGEPAWGGAADEFPPGYEEFVAARSRYFTRRDGRPPGAGAPATRRAVRARARAAGRRWAV